MSRDVRRSGGGHGDLMRGEEVGHAKRERALTGSRMGGWGWG